MIYRRGASLVFVRAAATSSQQTSVTDALQRRVQQGALRPDHDQLRAASVLDRLLTVAEAQRARVVAAAVKQQEEQEEAAALQRDPEPGPDEEPGTKVSAHSVVADGHVKKPELPAICGAYLWGSVGTGTACPHSLMHRNFATMPCHDASFYSNQQPPVQGRCTPLRCEADMIRSSDDCAGKTMMMDKFAAELRSHGIPVRRSHFHDFMLDVHAKLHDFHKVLTVL